MRSFILLLVIILLVLCSETRGFLVCPPGGTRQCSSGQVPYRLTSTNNQVISNCIYENCPQIIIDSCVGILFNNVTFRNGNGTSNLYSGGSIAIFGNSYQSSVTIMNSRFENILSGAAGLGTYQGGAIYATGTVLIYDTAFVNNSAVDQGGAIMISNALGFNCTRCLFTGNLATSGGAVAINQPLLNSPFIFIVDSTLDSNKAQLLLGSSALGGNFYVVGAGKLYTLNCTISNGYADTLGGGIYSTGRTNIYLRDTRGSTSYAPYSGFLHIDGGTGCKLTIQNSIFNENSGGFYGGALRVVNDAVIIIEGTLFKSNLCRYGSAIFLSAIASSNTVSLRNCTFDSEYNLASSAIYSEKSPLTLENCLFRNCHSEAFGGSINTGWYGKITMINTRFVNSSATNYGGALYVQNTGTLTIQGCSFVNCTSSFGGAMYLEPSPLTVTVSDSFFSGNRAFKLGGDVYALQSIITNMARCTFVSSYSSNGGSLYFEDGTSSVTGCQFFNGRSEQLGGSIYSVKVSGSPSFSLQNSQFYTCSSISGGSIALLNVPGVLDNATFIGSQASRYGGSIYAVGASLSISNSLSVNSSALVGGFLYAVSEGISIGGTNIVSSQSVLSGGSVSLLDSQLGMVGGAFTSSYSQLGGFIELSSGSAFQGLNVGFSNASASFGGVAYCVSSTFTCESCTFLNFNSPSNGSFLYVNDGSQVSLSSCQLSNPPGIITGSFIFVRMSTLSILGLEIDYLNGVTGIREKS